MRNLVLIQARMGSSRLPSKVMKDIVGKPDIQWVLERVSKSKKIDEVVVVTSIDKNNVPLINFVTGLGYRVFVGSENDVLDRYYQAARLLQPQYIIRVTADCPMFDWRFLDRAVDIVENDNSIDYLGSMTDTFPDGLDIEVMKYSVLKEAWKNACLMSEREHVTQYIRKHPEKYLVRDFVCDIKGVGDLRWTLDEEDDYSFIKNVYEHFMSNGKEFFLTEDILDYLKDKPEVTKINKHITRNEGLAKSIANDCNVIHLDEGEV